VTRRFPPPWSIEERQESFIVKDANGQHLAYVYFEDEPQRQLSTKRLSRDEAFLIAVNIAKLPSVPRQILKHSTAAELGQPRRLSCPKIIRNGHKLLLRNRATAVANMTAGSDREAVMRAYIMIAAFAALAMIAVAQTVSTEDRVIGAPDCTVDCSGQAANTDNGIGTSLPVDPNNYDDGGDN